MVTSDRTGTCQRISKQFSSQVSLQTGTITTLKYLYFTSSTLFLCIYSASKKKKNDNNNNNNKSFLIYISECSFLCTDLLTCISLHSFHCNLILVFLCSFWLQSSNTCILASSFIITHIHILTQKK